MSYVNLMENTLWSEADIVARGREIIAGQVPESRQNELRTIMLGHIAQMRAASQEEMAEIGLVQVLTEGVVLSNEAARADMALLAATLAHEVLVQRLAKPEELPFVMTAEVLDEEGNVLEPSVATEEVNPLYEADAAERADATIKIANASAKVLALYLLRNPVVEVVEEVLDEQAA